MGNFGQKKRGDPMQNSTIIANTSRIAKFSNHN